jgi:hypothetical protein
VKHEPWALALLAFLWAFGGSRAALAQTATMALYVEGPDAEAVRRAVVQALPDGLKLADDKAFHAELVREGQNRPLGKSLDPAVVDRVRRAARIMGVAAAVVVRVRRDPRGRLALVVVVPAWKMPASAEEVTLTFASHVDDVAALAAVLGPSLEPYAPQAPRTEDLPPPAPLASEGDLGQGRQCSATPSPAAPAAEGPAPTLASVPRSSAVEVARGPVRPQQTPAQIAAASVLDVALGGEVVGRHFEYRNGIQPGSSRYTLFPAPGARLRAQLFPLVRAGAPWGDLGILAEYVRIYSEMNDASGPAADVFPSSASAGLRARIHPGSRLVVGLSVEYTFTSRRSVGPSGFELPDVTYRAVRPAVDTRVSFGRASLLGEIGYRAIVDNDAISTRFYSPEGRGFDAEFGAALLLARAIEARFAVDYEFYSFAFTPPSGTTFGQGSARDELYGAQLAVAFVL